MWTATFRLAHGFHKTEFVVSGFFLHKFAAASFETTSPEAIQSKREKEGGEERKSERIMGMIRCLSKQHFFHPEGLCSSLAREGEMPHLMTVPYLSARPQMVRGS